MVTTTTSSDSTNEENSTEETSAAESTEEQTTEETSGQEATGDKPKVESTDAPKDDKKDPAKQALLADLTKERKDLKATRTERDALKTEVEALRPVQEALDAVQAKYDRLESFLQEVGGPLGKALDSRSFTQALFESDKDIADIVKDWNKANPTATSTALGSGPAAPASKAPNVNELLRAAANK